MKCWRSRPRPGEGVEHLLDEIVRLVPPPAGDRSAPLRALVFDSYYDAYRGVVCYVRVVDGVLAMGDHIRFMATADTYGADEVGVLTPKATPGGRARSRGSGLPDNRGQGHR